MKKGITLVVSICLTLLAFSQDKNANISGRVVSKESRAAIAYASVSLLNSSQDKLVKGTISQEDGFFVLSDVAKGNYIIKVSTLGFQEHRIPVTVGSLNKNFDMGHIALEKSEEVLEGVEITATQSEIDKTMNKKSYSVAELSSHLGGSVLEALKGLPGITTTREGKIELRGSDKVAVLLDGQQSALTGFGSQSGLENVPASAIERIEIINNPSARYDANAQAGIVNIILKKQNKVGFNGQVGMSAGVGALWEKVDNMPGINPQYKMTPKINPSLSLNYRAAKTNVFLQSDFLWFKKLNKNEFFDRDYSNGNFIQQQYLENRTQNIPTVRLGMDWFVDDANKITFAGNYSRKSYVGRGSLPYYTANFASRERLWLFREEEIEAALGITANYVHSFRQPGHKFEVNGSYTELKKEEYYYLDNITPNFTGNDKFDLYADQKVSDLNIDYVKPLRYGRVEMGSKFRWRYLPINIDYFPGQQTVIDVSAGGWANYSEIIPAVYTNYLYEHNRLETEIGLRAEYVSIDYEVTPNHNTYSSDGYNYFKLFPSVRLGMNLDDRHKISVFYNLRVDRPEEKALRVFPKYDDPEILKIGNPTLDPQYTQSVEIGFRKSWGSNSLYVATYHRYTTDVISNIYTSSPQTGLIYSTPQNTGSGSNTGVEIVYNQVLSKMVNININANGYYNKKNAFEVQNQYPFPVTYKDEGGSIYAGNVKINSNINLSKGWKAQVFGTYFTRDNIPQGYTSARYSIDLGLKKGIQKGKGEIFLNGTDIFNTMEMKQTIKSDNVTIQSIDYLETQVFRLGYTYKF